MVDPVVLGGADRLVETAGPAGRGDDVPQPDAALGEPRQALLVAQRLQLLADGCAKQPPELVGRVRILALRRERGIAGQAAEDEQARIGPRD